MSQNGGILYAGSTSSDSSIPIINVSRSSLISENGEVYFVGSLPGDSGRLFDFAGNSMNSYSYMQFSASDSMYARFSTGATVPVGIASKHGKIVNNGIVCIKGLTPGRTYYFDEDKGLTANRGRYKVGIALSKNELLLQLN